MSEKPSDKIRKRIEQAFPSRELTTFEAGEIESVKQIITDKLTVKEFQILVQAIDGCFDDFERIAAKEAGSYFLPLH